MKTITLHRLLRRQLAGLAVLALCSSWAGAAQGQWAQDGYDPAKTYANKVETTLARSNVALLVPKWQKQLGQFYASSVIQSDGRLFVCSNLLGVSAQAPGTGDLLWEQSEAGVGNCGNPALSGEVAYLVSSALNPDRNMLAAVDAASGEVLWRAKLPKGGHYLNLGAGPALQDKRLYVSTSRTAVLALSAGDGSVAWQASTGGGVVLNNDVAVAGGRVFVSTWHECCDTASRQLFAFDAANGQPLWARDTDASNMQYPAMVLGRQVFVGNDKGLVYAFRASDGQPQWSRQLTGYMSAPLVGHGKAVYAVGGNKIVHALDAATGDLLWTRAVAPGSFVTSNLAWANGLLYLVTEDGGSGHLLLALNAGTGKVVASLPLSLSGSYSKLTVSDGRVLLSTNGVVLALGL